MITWMQTHRKWLVITIWIATIAFIGAGFVGWGSYNYGTKADTVAKIKNTIVSVKDVQNQYQKLFNEENRQLGGTLDEATAKKMGLENKAYILAIQKAMLIQFAKDNGLYVTKKELADTIFAIPAFQKNGVFSEAYYKAFLRQRNMTAHEFETNLKKDILVQKLLNALSLEATPTTKTTYASYFTMEDKVCTKTIKAPKTISVSDNEIKAFWEKHKNKYKSSTSYNIGYYYVTLNDSNTTIAQIKAYYESHKQKYKDKDGKILSFKKAENQAKIDLLANKTKLKAVKTMKKLKSEKIEFKKANNIDIKNDYIPTPLMVKLLQSKTKFLKPILTNKGWLIAKLFNINKPAVLPYEKAKNMAKKDLIAYKKKELLIQLAKANSSNIDEKQLGFIGRDDVTKLKNMSISDAALFLSKLFDSNTTKGYVLLPNDVSPSKVVLFNITEQKLLDKKKLEKNKKIIYFYANRAKQIELNKQLIQELENLYQSEIKIYMKM